MKLLKINGLYLVLLINIHCIVINEIYLNPVSSAYYSQWIELFNNSREQIKLDDFHITDSNNEPALIIPWASNRQQGLYPRSLTCMTNLTTNSLTLEPYSFAVILDRDYDLTNKEDNICSRLPAHTTVLTVNTPALDGGCTFLKYNGDRDQLYLLDSQGQSVASCNMHTAAEQNEIKETFPGKSLVMLNPAAGDRPSNWCTAIAPGGATPGKSNLITSMHSFNPAAYFQINPFGNMHTEKGRLLPVEIFALTSKGMLAANCGTKLTVQTAEKIAFKETSALDYTKRTSRSITLNLLRGRSGIFAVWSPFKGCFQLTIKTADNQTYSSELTVRDFSSSLKNKLVFSEIMFSATTALGLDNSRYENTEYIEIANISSNAIYLSRLKLQKHGLGPATDWLLPDFNLAPGQHAVICACKKDFEAVYQKYLPTDQSVPVKEVAFSALAEEQNLALVDSAGETIDCISYSKSWLKSCKRYGTLNNIKTGITSDKFIAIVKKDYNLSSLMRANWYNSPVKVRDIIFQDTENIVTAGTTNSVTNRYVLPLLASPGQANQTAEREKPDGVKIKDNNYIYKQYGLPLCFIFTTAAAGTCNAAVYSLRGVFLGYITKGREMHINTGNELYFDGLLQGKMLRPGLYFLVIEAHSRTVSENTRARTCFAVKK